MVMRLMMMKIFDVAWDFIIKAPYHITERENIDSIMQSGLEPRYPGFNASMGEGIDAILEENDWEIDEDEALNQLNEIAQNLGFKHADELYDPNINWVYGINDDHVREVLNDLSFYGSSMKEPVLLYLNNSYKKWMPDYGFTWSHVRSPFTVPPKNIEIEINDLPKQADFERSSQYEEALEEAFMNHFIWGNRE